MTHSITNEGSTASSSPFFFEDNNIPVSFAANTNQFLSRSHSARDNVNWQSSSFLAIVDDDEMSIGTIDSISNITQIYTYCA